MSFIDINFSKAKKFIKKGKILEAKTIFENILFKYPNNIRVKNSLNSLINELEIKNHSKKDDVSYEIDAVNEVIFLYQKNMITEAFAKAESLIKKFKNNEKLIVTLGCLYSEMANVTKAIELFNEALKLNPKSTEAMLNMGATLKDIGEIDNAIKYYINAIKIDENCFNAYGNLGCSYTSIGDYEKAIEYFKSGIQIAPNDPSLFANMGQTYHQMNKIAEAHRCFFRSLDIDPNCLIAHINQGVLYLKLGNYDNAIISFEHALRIDEKSIEANLNYAALLGDIGKYNEAESYIEKVLKIDPKINTAISNLLLMSNYSSENCKKYISELHKKNGNLIESNFQLLNPHKFSYFEDEVKEKINIGFVSADLHQHSITYFLEPLLKNFNKDEFSVSCFSNSFFTDHVTKRIKSLADYWYEVASLNNIQLSKLINEKKIDVLIDLSGHTEGNRMPVFAMKPSKIQMTWLGYPNTTGMKSIDYRIVDNYTDPENLNDHLYTEKLLRMDKSFICFSSEENSIIKKNTYFNQNDFFTFGSFNNLSKISDEVVECWAEILNKYKNSKIILKNKQLNSNYMRDIYLERFHKYGVSSEKIILLSWSNSRKAHLETYNSIDLALDTFPYNGTTTTFESLWMNVPVLCLEGNNHSGRVGYSILKNLKLEELITTSQTQYIDKASYFLENKNYLEKISKGLREKLINSDLCNAGNFTNNFEKILKNIIIENNNLTHLN